MSDWGSPGRTRLSDEVLNAKGLHAAAEKLNETSAPFLHLDLRARGGGLVLFNVSADAYEVIENTRLVDVLDVQPGSKSSSGE